MTDNHIPMKLSSGAWVCTCLMAARFMRLGHEALCEHVLLAQARGAPAKHQRERPRIHQPVTHITYESARKRATILGPNGQTFVLNGVTKEQAQAFGDKTAAKWGRNALEPYRMDRMMRPTNTVQ